MKSGRGEVTLLCRILELFLPSPDGNSHPSIGHLLLYNMCYLMATYLSLDVWSLMPGNSGMLFLRWCSASLPSPGMTVFCIRTNWKCSACLLDLHVEEDCKFFPLCHPYYLTLASASGLVTLRVKAKKIHCIWGIKVRCFYPNTQGISNIRKMASSRNIRSSVSSLRVYLLFYHKDGQKTKGC